MHNRIFIVMGVSGVGKTSVATGLAQHFKGQYIEADDLHPDENIVAMRQGIALTDEMRAPWLRAVAQAILDEQARGSKTVVATCSALKRSYRDLIRGIVPEAYFIHLTGAPSLIADRMAAREAHFMPLSLLQSQLATLEPLTPDEPHCLVDVAGTAKEVLERTINLLDP